MQNTKRVFNYLGKLSNRKDSVFSTDDDIDKFKKIVKSKHQWSSDQFNQEKFSKTYCLVFA